MSLETLLENIYACNICADSFLHEPRPVLSINPKARILIIGQAPGRKVHESGIPWNDASGIRLRHWLNMSENDFYNDELVAIMPMAFCYPGKGKSGDMAPPKICSKTWHQAILNELKEIKLILLVGNYAIKEYFPTKDKIDLSTAVRMFNQKKPFLALPHPSPRNINWFKKNPWFEKEILPKLEILISELRSNKN